MLIWSLFGTVSLFFLIFLLSACTTSKPYHTNQTNEEAGTKNSGMVATVTPCFAPQNNPEYRACVRFVEYDDFGNAFNREQLNETLTEASAVARRDGIIVVYVHGWEHNAQSGDDDVEAFYHAMQNAQALDLQYQDKREVFGIYIGWRGKSSRIPGVSKLTFWERKTTAQAIGDGAVFELFRRLANERQKSPHSRLVLIGHSFGAAVMYASVFHSITSQIIDDPSNANEVKLTSSDASKRWDMVVLINPAFEAMQLRSHLELARSREYLSSQLPHLLIITTQADWATGIAFPAGRYVRSIFNNYGDDNASPELYRTAVGHYIPYVTHQLTAIEDCASFRQVDTAVAIGDKLSGVAEKSTVCFDDARARLPKTADGRKALPVLLTRCDEPGDCALVAGQHRMVLKKHMPILNIRTTADVMSGHNDIWNPTMQAFLVQMMLSIVHRPDAETAAGRQVNASSGPNTGK